MLSGISPWSILLILIIVIVLFGINLPLLGQTFPEFTATG